MDFGFDSKLPNYQGRKSPGGNKFQPVQAVLSTASAPKARNLCCNPEDFHELSRAASPGRQLTQLPNFGEKHAVSATTRTKFF